MLLYFSKHPFLLRESIRWIILQPASVFAMVNELAPQWLKFPLNQNWYGVQTCAKLPSLCMVYPNSFSSHFWSSGRFAMAVNSPSILASLNCATPCLLAEAVCSLTSFARTFRIKVVSPLWKPSKKVSTSCFAFDACNHVLAMWPNFHVQAFFSWHVGNDVLVNP